MRRHRPTAFARRNAEAIAQLGGRNPIDKLLLDPPVRLRIA